MKGRLAFTGRPFPFLLERWRMAMTFYPDEVCGEGTGRPVGDDVGHLGGGAGADRDHRGHPGVLLLGEGLVDLVRVGPREQLVVRPSRRPHWLRRPSRSGLRTVEPVVVGLVVLGAGLAVSAHGGYSWVVGACRLHVCGAALNADHTARTSRWAPSRRWTRIDDPEGDETRLKLWLTLWLKRALLR